MDDPEEGAVEVLAPAVGAWLARPCATALVWATSSRSWKEELTQALAANRTLRILHITTVSSFAFIAAHSHS